MSGTVCAAGRVGFWSGYKAGGCFGIADHSRQYSLGVDVLFLGGGTITTFDILTQPYVAFNLAGPASSNFGNLYVKIGATFPLGLSVPTSGERGGMYIRWGGLVGLGYDVELADHVAWRILEASFFTEGQLRPQDGRTGVHGPTRPRLRHGPAALERLLLSLIAPMVFRGSPCRRSLPAP